MSNITIYTTSWCPSCVNAKAFLAGKGAEFTEVDIESWDDPRGQLAALTGHRSVPQIVVGDTIVGGFEDLLALHQDGALELMLSDVLDA